MAPRSYARRSPYNNPLANLTGEQDELVSLQGPVRRSDIGSDEAPTPSEAPTLPLVPPIKDLFTKFIKAFVESTQAWDREQAEPQKRPLKARSPETYLRKSHMDCYHFCQQCKDHFETLGATGMNCILFTASFLCSTISLRWAQHKCRYQSTTSITWSKFKTFLRKNLENSQAFIDNIWSKFRKDSQY